MSDPNSTILTRIHAAHPDAEVTRSEGGMWEARMPDGPTGIRVVYRRDLADVEAKLDDLAEERRLRARRG